MKSFQLHDQSSAPQAAKPLLEDSMNSFGMIPGLHAVMAEAPGVLDAYKKLHALFLDSSFDADEQTVVWQSINVEHGCNYCVPAHTGIAKSMKVSDDVTNPLRDEMPLPSERLEALRSFTLVVLRNRGEVADADLQAFYAAGYEQRHVLEVILGLSQKIMSNYINHIAKTPVDKPFMKFEWQKVKK